MSAFRTIWETDRAADVRQVKIHLNEHSDDWAACLWASTENGAEYIHLSQDAATLSGSVAAFRKLHALIDDALTNASLDASALPRESQ